MDRGDPWLNRLGRTISKRPGPALGRPVLGLIEPERDELDWPDQARTGPHCAAHGPPGIAEVWSARHASRRARASLGELAQ